MIKKQYIFGVILPIYTYNINFMTIDHSKLNVLYDDWIIYYNLTFCALKHHMRTVTIGRKLLG